MEGRPALKKNWVVTQAAFDRLLAQLDPDRESAGRRYEEIRHKLAKFFQWRGCLTPEEYADRTIDIVARRIDEGAPINAGNPYLFFHGVALNVLREHWKEAQKAEMKPLDETPEMQIQNAQKQVEPEADKAENEHRLECLEECVQKLPAQQLLLITQYHQGEGGAKIARRNELARQLNIPLNALRIRAYRIRGELENCITECRAGKLA
jgi:DNA-directed RNA polymerase specialized sigma24 family protein